MAVALPFLTLSDPVVTGEGALDPLGLASIGDRLADQILPGMRARMSRPRFLTAIAVSSVVCEGLEEAIAFDGITPASIVFEWLLVEGFARDRSEAREDMLRIPGIAKAEAAVRTDEPMRGSAYLKNPGVFGFHGVYKPLAQHIGIVDNDLRLSDRGYELLRAWEREQGLEGFLQQELSVSNGASVRNLLRAAVEDGLRNGYTKRSAVWQGWRFFKEHQTPGQVGAEEARSLCNAILDSKGGTRGEVFRLLGPTTLRNDQSEVSIVREVVLPQASAPLAERIAAIVAYEEYCGLIEGGFEWLRYLSSQAGAHAVGVTECTRTAEIREIARRLPGKFAAAEDALAVLSMQIQKEFSELAGYFAGMSTPEQLYEAVLHRHADVQRSKPPDGKRDWFEHGTENTVFIRIPYRLDDRPEDRDEWNRPYRLLAVRSFCADLKWTGHE